MRLVCISDTHEHHQMVSDIPDGDVLIHCGDITAYGSLTTLFDFNEWMKEQPHPYKIVTAGNHDRVRNSQIRKILTDVIYLDEESLEFEGVKFYVCSQTPSPWDEIDYHSYNRRDKETTKKLWEKIPMDTDVLITHGPPQGIRDLTRKNERVGCEVLLERVVKVKPKVHIFGHIHECHGITNQRYGIKFVNCSLMNEKYDLKNKPIVIDV